jgi:hypothetical protein
MSDPKNSNRVTSQGKASAGVAGASGGTLIVLLANKLPDNSLRDFLILAAPSVSVFLGGFALWLQVKAANYIRDREARLIFSQTKHVLEAALNNGSTSASHKKQIRLKLEDLENRFIRRHVERMDSVNIVTEQEIIERMNSS